MSHPLHPLLVHFPIALLYTTVLFEVLGYLLKKEALRQTALWLLSLGLAGGVVAAIAGEWGEEFAEAAGVPEAAIDRHETFAILSLVAFGILLVFRLWRGRGWIPQNEAVYFAIAMVGLLLLGTAGFFGGELVYRYGAGVERPASQPAGPSSGR
jgi:uncharacterized membrane protein